MVAVAGTGQGVVIRWVLLERNDLGFRDRREQFTYEKEDEENDGTDGEPCDDLATMAGQVPREGDRDQQDQQGREGRRNALTGTRLEYPVRRSSFGTRSAAGSGIAAVATGLEWRGERGGGEGNSGDFTEGGQQSRGSDDRTTP